MAGHTTDPGVSVTARALALLGAFDEDHRSLALSELARRAGLPLPTAHRLVAELVAWGALAKNGGGTYDVGRRLWAVGLLAPVNTDLVETASPFLHDLYAATHATVHFAVRDAVEALYLDRRRGHASVPIVSTVGTRLPLHATGVGKVLLAHAPEEVTQWVLEHLDRVTPYTVVRPGTLLAQLERVHRDGYATTREEMSLGACSVAVPVCRHGAVVGALGIVVPTLRRKPEAHLAALRVAAGGIGRELSRT